MSRPKPHESLEELVTVEQVLAREDAQAWTDRWRRVYAAPTKRATGRWMNGGYDWHTFSFSHAPSVCLDEAKAAYVLEAAGPLVVLPDGPSRRTSPALLVRGAPPMLSHTDTLVFPPDLAWTMAFTHEDDWLGPYFCRREWIADANT